jgi:hypothetical protein
VGLNRVWPLTLTDLDDGRFAITYAPGHEFAWHGPAMFELGFSTAEHAARDLLERHGSRIGWREGEDLLQRCRDYDLALRL